jgi:hypothetical protein
MRSKQQQYRAVIVTGSNAHAAYVTELIKPVCGRNYGLSFSSAFPIHEVVMSGSGRSTLDSENYTTVNVFVEGSLSTILQCALQLSQLKWVGVILIDRC